jgi:hypothetical protein
MIIIIALLCLPPSTTVYGTGLSIASQRGQGGRIPSSTIPSLTLQPPPSSASPSCLSTLYFRLSGPDCRSNSLSLSLYFTLHSRGTPSIHPRLPFVLPSSLQPLRSTLHQGPPSPIDSNRPGETHFLGPKTRRERREVPLLGPSLLLLRGLRPPILSLRPPAHTPTTPTTPTFHPSLPLPCQWAEPSTTS